MHVRVGFPLLLVALVSFVGCNRPAVPREELGKLVFEKEMSQVPGAEEPVNLPLPDPPEEEEPGPFM